MRFTSEWAKTIFEKLCESPMELAFISEWVTTFEECRVGLDEFLKLPQRVTFTPLHLEQIEYIVPQFAIGKYRADFLLARVATGWIEDPEDPDEIITILEKLPLIVVEIDGHDFHEKTKEQASRDKERDRFMTAEGYRVFRFTGSDVFNRAAQCVQEINSAFSKMGSFYDPVVREWNRINTGK